jgi:hypothetical protein
MREPIGDHREIEQDDAEHRCDLVHLDPERLTHCVALADALVGEGVSAHPGAIRAALRRFIDG